MDEDITCFREILFPREYTFDLDGNFISWDYKRTALPGKRVFVYGGFEGKSLVWEPPPKGWVYQKPYIPFAPNYPDYYIAYLES
jgi:hypothetical protein